MSSFRTAPGLDVLVDASRALPEFKAAVHAFSSFRPDGRIVVVGHAPRVKVLRVIAQLLAAEPALAVERVHLRANSGCSDFRGELRVVANDVERVWEFAWDCRWRAREAGLLDALGYPDQARAAREFGWQCFAVWAERTGTR